MIAPSDGARVERPLGLQPPASAGATRLARALGLVEPTAAGAEHDSRRATAGRLRRMLRLHRDLGVNLDGAAIIVDLLERLERLEAELARSSAPGPASAPTTSSEESETWIPTG